MLGGELKTNKEMEDKVEGCGGMRVRLSGGDGCWRLERVEEASGGKGGGGEQSKKRYRV